MSTLDWKREGSGWRTETPQIAACARPRLGMWYWSVASVDGWSSGMAPTAADARADAEHKVDEHLAAYARETAQ